MTYSGIPLDTPIEMKIKDVRLSVPIGYMWNWPDSSALGKVNDYKGLHLFFWMPSKRYPEVHGFSTPFFRPRIKGKEFNPNAHTVNAVLNIVDIDDPDYLSPEDRFHNITKISGLQVYEFEEKPFGLVNFRRTDGFPNLSGKDWYRSPEGTQPLALISCIPLQDKRVPNPNCRADMHFEQEKLAILASFPSDAIRQWREIAHSIRDLFNSFKVKP